MEKKWPIALLAGRIGRGRLLRCGIFPKEDFGQVLFSLQIEVAVADRGGSLRIIGAFPIPLAGTM